MSNTESSALTREQQREYLQRMRQAYEEIDRRRRRDWARLDYRKNLPILDSLLDMAYHHRKPQPTSGLVQLQRILQRQRRMS